MRKKILVIEDNLFLLENTAEILELASYEVIKARNGKEGLILAHQEKPDLILCDIQMPELDGFGVLRAMQNALDLRRIPFVFATSKSAESDRRLGMSMGADDYVVKPYSGEELLTIVETRLRRATLFNEIETRESASRELFLEGDQLVEQIEPLMKKIVVKKYAKKERLFLEGDSSSFLYYLLKGKVKVFHTSECGKEYIARIYKEKEFFAYDSLLDKSIHDESAETLEDCEVGLIPKKDFYHLLENNHGLCVHFIHYLATNISEMKDSMVKLAYCSARKKLAESILYFGAKYRNDENDEMRFPVSRHDISSRAGISPESSSRNLTDFREEGLIDFSSGVLQVLNPNKLRSLRG